MSRELPVGRLGQNIYVHDHSAHTRTIHTHPQSADCATAPAEAGAAAQVRHAPPQGNMYVDTDGTHLTHRQTHSSAQPSCRNAAWARKQPRHVLPQPEGNTHVDIVYRTQDTLHVFTGTHGSTQPSCRTPARAWRREEAQWGRGGEGAASKRRWAAPTPWGGGPPRRGGGRTLPPRRRTQGICTAYACTLHTS